MALFSVNAPDVAFELFGGEVVVINFVDGRYFNLRGSAALIWSLLAQGHDSERIGGALAGHFGMAEEALAAEVRSFVETLLAEGLVVARRADEPLPGDLKLEQAPNSWSPPLLESYSDMQELLLLDPIHEVNVTGWPDRPSSGSSSSS